MQETSSVVEQINGIAQFLAEEDLDEWVIPQLLGFYSSKINTLAVKAYGQSASANSEGPSIAQLAFRERSKSELRSAVYTFVFKSEHWRSGRDINTYLLTCLNRLADRIRWDANSVRKTNTPVCPAAKFLNRKEFLNQEGRLLRSQFCTEELERAKEEIEILKVKKDKIPLEHQMLMKLEARSRLFRAFSLHSRRGYRCPECNKFLPESINGPYGISCPYEDCIFSGTLPMLERMAHPVGLTQRNDLSLQTPISDADRDSKQIQDTFVSEVIDADVQMEVSENFQQEYSVLSKVIDEQVEAIKRTNAAGTMIQKLRMYEAYGNMLNKYPEDMVSYLVHRKQNADFPIQSRIFQEYVMLMQDTLPFEIKRGDDVYDVLSLTDPNISLFLGVSEFDATVRSDYTIPNCTTESYIGGRKFKDYGPCFIGMIIDVVNRDTGESLKDYVNEYSFVQIKVQTCVKVGTPVKVTHYRMPSHYEMGSLVYLQRTRRRIVDRIYYKIHKKKRISGT